MSNTRKYRTARLAQIVACLASGMTLIETAIELHLSLQALQHAASLLHELQRFNARPTAEERRQFRRATVDEILEARRRGLRWDDVAADLNLSPQALWQTASVVEDIRGGPRLPAIEYCRAANNPFGIEPQGMAA